MGFANTPAPPYYAVIFTTQRATGEQGYSAAAERMMELAPKQRECLGAETVRDPNGFGIKLSYWADEKSIASWKAHAEHLVAQRRGDMQTL